MHRHNEEGMTSVNHVREIISVTLIEPHLTSSQLSLG